MMWKFLRVFDACFREFGNVCGFRDCFLLEKFEGRSLFREVFYSKVSSEGLVVK